MSNTAKGKDDVVVLGEREFKRVKNGLDETEVASLVDQLINERDKLAQSQDHIASLNRLAERNIVEADRLATQIKTEAAEQAKAESTAILDKAKEQARQMTEQKIAEAEEIANEKAKEIKAKAEQEAALLLENQKTRIRSELRNLVNEQFGYMLDELENLKQQASAVQTEFGNKLSEATVESSSVTQKVTQERDMPDVEAAKESAAMESTGENEAIAAENRDAAAPERTGESEAIRAEDRDASAAEGLAAGEATAAEDRDASAPESLAAGEATAAEDRDASAPESLGASEAVAAEDRHASAPESAVESEAPAAEETDTTVTEASKKASEEHLEASHATEQAEKSSELAKLLQIEERAESDKPQWEMEILPPFDISKIMEVVSHLDQLPEVANTEMIVPQIDMPSILVFLREPLNLIDVLQTIPAVAHVEEVTIDKASTNGEPGKAPRKVRINLAESTTSQEKK
jgi:hypothetical protein